LCPLSGVAYGNAGKSFFGSREMVER
jgi:hypothetical protein